MLLEYALPGFFLIFLFFTDFKSLKETKDLSWMHDIQLADSSRQQNLEIIYNNNKVYFKTIKTVYKDEPLTIFPSKDLEISLGLQFIPIQTGKFLLRLFWIIKNPLIANRKLFYNKNFI